MQKFYRTDIVIFSLIVLLLGCVGIGSLPLWGQEADLAESAREMMQVKHYLQPRLIFKTWYHAPLAIWLKVLSMYAFGINEWGVRLPNLLFFLLTLISIYHYAYRWKGRFFAQIAVASLLAMPFLYWAQHLYAADFSWILFLALHLLLTFECKISLLRQREELSPEDYRPWLAGLFLGLALMGGGITVLLFVLLFYLISITWGFAMRFYLSIALRVFLGMLLSLALWVGMCLSFMGKDWLWGQLGTWISELELLPNLIKGLIFLLFAAFPASAWIGKLWIWRSEKGEDNILKRFFLSWILAASLLAFLKPELWIMASLAGAMGAALYVSENQAKGLESSLTKLLWGWSFWVLPFSAINGIFANLDIIRAKFPEGLWKIQLGEEMNLPYWAWLIPTLLCLLALWNILQNRGKALLFLYVQLLIVGLGYAWIQGGLLPNMQPLSTKALADFGKSIRGKDAYLITLPQNSLTYFYARTPVPEHIRYTQSDWLNEGDIDKPVYLVIETRLVNSEFVGKYRYFKRLYQQNGYSFYLRSPKSELENLQAQR